MFYSQDSTVTEIGRGIVDRLIDAGRDYNLTEGDVSVAFIVHEVSVRPGVTARPPVGFGWRAAEAFYPCSVVKLFWLLGCQARLEEGYIQPHSELDRAVHDMIKWSSNTATNYVIDLVTGTTGDTLLDGDTFAAWAEARSWLNRYLRALGWPEIDAGVNVCQKNMDDDRYGRERQFVDSASGNHNSLTANAVARLYWEILCGRAVSMARSEAMVNVMHRPLDRQWVEQNPSAQVKGYLGAGLPDGSSLWSKAGWTGWTGDVRSSYNRHDSAYIEVPGLPPFTLVAFARGKGPSEDPALMPAVAAQAREMMGRLS